MIEIRDTIAQKEEQEHKDKWRRADWARRGFGGYSDEEKQILDYIYGDETEPEGKDVTYDEALEKAMEVERKFKEADGITKVNPLE